MFKRFASALFGDDAGELSRGSGSGDGKEEEEEAEDWILINYLGNSYFTQISFNNRKPRKNKSVSKKKNNYILLIKLNY